MAASRRLGPENSETPVAIAKPIPAAMAKGTQGGTGIDRLSSFSAAITQATTASVIASDQTMAERNR